MVYIEVSETVNKTFMPSALPIHMTPIFQQYNGFLNNYMENDLLVYLKNKITGIRLELDNTLKDYIVQPQIIISSGESLM